MCCTYSFTAFEHYVTHGLYMYMYIGAEDMKKRLTHTYVVNISVAQMEVLLSQIMLKYTPKKHVSTGNHLVCNINGHFAWRTAI